jgi:hypothetical protein
MKRTPLEWWLCLLLASGAQARSLENDDIRVELSPGTGSITRLVDKRSGAEMITDSQQASLYQLMLAPIGERTRRILSWQQKAAVVQVGAGQLEIRYAALQPDEAQYIFGAGVMHFPEPQLEVRAVVSLRLDGAHVVGRLHIENRSRETILGVAFPVLGGLAPGTQDNPARIVLPSLSQRVFTRTLGAFTGERVNRYPAMLAASWLSYESGSFNLGIEARSDPEAQDAWFALEPGHFEPGSAYRGRYRHPFIAWLSWPHIAAQSDWTSPEMWIHLHGGDWHTLSAEHREWYRARLDQSADRSGGDRWRESPGFATYRLKRDDNTVDWTYADLDRLAESAADAGIDRLVIEGWRAIEGAGNPAPRGEIADPRLGGAAGLKAANERLAPRGVELLFAFHPALMNVRADEYPSADALWAVRTSRQADQIPVSFLAHTFDWPAAIDTGHLLLEIDPTSGASGFLLGEATRLQAEYGMRNLFLKGVGQRAFLSYGRNRGTVPQDTYRIGYEKLLGGLRRIYPEGLIVNEGFNDLVNPHADAAYTWDQGHDAAILPYSVPWHYLSNDVEALDYAAANASFAHKALINLVIDGGRGHVARYPEFASHLRALRDLKRSSATCYADAEFRDREGLRKVEAPDHVVVSTYRHLESGALGIVMANLGGEAAPVSFELETAEPGGTSKLFRQRADAGEQQKFGGALLGAELQPFEVALYCLEQGRPGP